MTIDPEEVYRQTGIVVKGSDRKDRLNQFEARGKTVFDSLPVDDRVALTSYMFHVIANHDGSYRYLIYDTLGLPREGGTYSKCYPDGMIISNIMGDADRFHAMFGVDLDKK